jgi:diguanylate cyclase (GGDEF)-like protein
MRLPIQRRLFYSHFFAVVLVSGSIGTFFYTSAVDSLFGSLQARLKYSASLLSRSVDATALAGLRTGADTGQPAYIEHLQLLRDFQAANQDIAFVYIMRRDGEKISFVVDSDTSEKQALPGEPYTEATPQLIEGFERAAADAEIAHDAWGYFLSGFAPLKSGQGQYLIGLDMRADEVHRKFQAVRAAGIASLVLSVVLAYLFSKLLAARIVRPVKLLATRATEIAAGVLGGRVEVASRDELGDLAGAFNSMSAALDLSQATTEQAMVDLERANVTLEERVAQRTASLAELNDQLTVEVQERERVQEALAKAATTDYLTGLLNRPAMLVMLEKEMERTRRHHQVSCVLLADLDGFKLVNDALGHDVGDQVLTAVAHRMCVTVRAQDVVARWGGDELLILLPSTSPEGARLAAEKLRTTFESTFLVVDSHQTRLTLSVGVSVIDGALSIREVIHRADTALYQAKANGRNCVVMAP